MTTSCGSFWPESAKTFNQKLRKLLTRSCESFWPKAVEASDQRHKNIWPEGVEAFDQKFRKLLTRSCRSFWFRLRKLLTWSYESFWAVAAKAFDLKLWKLVKLLKQQMLWSEVSKTGSGKSLGTKAVKTSNQKLWKHLTISCESFLLRTRSCECFCLQAVNASDQGVVPEVYVLKNLCMWK